MAVYEQVSRKGTGDSHTRDGGEGGSGGVKEGSSLHHLCFNLPLTQLENDLSELSVGQQDGEAVRCVYG